MSALLIYVFPIVMDLVLSAVFFMATVWGAEQGWSASQVANLITIWAIAYMAVSLTSGRLVTPRTSGYWLIGSCLGTAVLAAGFASATSTGMMYVLMALQGVAIAAFFTPFQVFMKAVGEVRQRSLSSSVGLYVFAWSSGFALGPFISSWMWVAYGWRTCHAINGVVALGVAGLTWAIQHHVRRHPHGEAPPAAVEIRPDTVDLPNYAWMSWVYGGIGCVAVSMIRGLFPSTGASFGMSRFNQGLVLAALSAMQAIGGLMLCRSRSWMFKPLPIVLSGLFGVGGLLLLAAGRGATAFQLAGAAFGVFTAGMYFYYVYYSLLHPSRSSWYVSVNEAVVGLAAIVGPFAGGLIADRFSLPVAYTAMAAVLLASVLAHAVSLRMAGRGKEGYRRQVIGDR